MVISGLFFFGRGISLGHIWYCPSFTLDYVQGSLSVKFGRLYVLVGPNLGRLHARQVNYSSNSIWFTYHLRGWDTQNKKLSWTWSKLLIFFTHPLVFSGAWVSLSVASTDKAVLRKPNESAASKASTLHTADLINQSVNWLIRFWNHTQQSSELLTILHSGIAQGAIWDARD